MKKIGVIGAGTMGSGIAQKIAKEEIRKRIKKQKKKTELHG